MSWRESCKVVCLNYREYSCGRFVSNILSYNSNFLPLYNLDMETSLEKYTDINYKHHTILKTIPLNDNLQKWRLYELQCNNFYGIKVEYDQKLYKELFHAPTNTIKKIPFDKLLGSIKERAKLLIEQNKYYVFFTTHNDLQLKLVQTIFPNTVVVQLINDTLVNDLSKQLKAPQNLLQDRQNIVSTFTLNEDFLKFDIGSMFEAERFFQEVKILIQNLGCTNISLDPLVLEYYEKYISIYKPYLNKVI